MADKQISDLAAANAVQAADLFVLEQDSTAKKLTGQILVNWLTNYADGHGGIHSITWVDSGTSGDGRLHTATIHYADTTTSTFSVRDGWKGDQGDTWYFWIKYSADLPTSDEEMGDYPDKYIGVYIGTADTAPTHYSNYEWYQWKGDKGDTGDPCAITGQSVGYLTSSSGTTPPTGQWEPTVPQVTPGEFLWTQTTVTYNTGDVISSYSVARFGIDGNGSVSTVNTISPDPNGNVQLPADSILLYDNDSVQEHITNLEVEVESIQGQTIYHVSGNITALPAVFSYNWITADHRIINCVFGTPSAIKSNLTWVTSAGSVTFTGTLASGGSTTIDFDIVKPNVP